MRKTSTAPAVLWYCVVNVEGTILGVYGSALGDKAREQRDELRAQFPFAGFDVRTTTQARPRVGQRI